jgi:hypothetical protein
MKEVVPIDQHPNMSHGKDQEKKYIMNVQNLKKTGSDEAELDRFLHHHHMMI